jgi:hypothetical protein
LRTNWLGLAQAAPDEFGEVTHALNVVLVILDEILPVDEEGLR